ncbi:MAG TPA: 50S ribosomal protein L24 [Polyangiaceae bacterium]|jgi:large subunit ribosomal protein L24|nr:50S ribosomal protein L24 [Polyangiaceae bacterium]
MQRLTVGDQVVVIRGNDKGKRGKVSKLTSDRVVVEGVNVVKRHLKQTPQRPGGILDVEAPISKSNVMLVDPATNKPTRVSVKIENDKKVRVGKSGTAILAAKEK